MDEVWGPSSMALPQMNCSPSLPAAIAGSSKQAEDDSDEPTYAPSLLILAPLRAGWRRHPCRRGKCMFLQAPRRRRGRRAIAQPMNQEAAIKARVGQHGAICIPTKGHKDGQNCRAAPERTRQPPIAEPSQARLWFRKAMSQAAKSLKDPTLAKPSNAKLAYGPGLRSAASHELQAASQDAKAAKKKEKPGSHRPPSLPPGGLWSRTMPNCRGRRKTLGNMLPSTRPKLSQTNSQLACTNTADFKTKEVNFKMDTKISGQTEDFILPKATIIEKPRNNEKETFKMMFDDVKTTGGHIVPRVQGTSSKKFSTSEFTRAMTFSTTKDKMLVIEDCTDIKARPSIKSKRV